MPMTRNQTIEAWFRDYGWTPEQENYLMDKLREYVGNNVVPDSEVWNNFSYALSLEINEQFQVNFSPLKVKTKIHKEWQRFNDFIQFSQLPGVQYDQSKNVVTVDREYWAHTGRETYARRFFRSHGYAYYEIKAHVFRFNMVPNIDIEGEGGFDEDNPIEISDDTANIDDLGEISDEGEVVESNIRRMG